MQPSYATYPALKTAPGKLGEECSNTEALAENPVSYGKGPLEALKAYPSSSTAAMSFAMDMGKRSPAPHRFAEPTLFNLTRPERASCRTAGQTVIQTEFERPPDLFGCLPLPTSPHLPPSPPTALTRTNYTARVPRNGISDSQGSMTNLFCTSPNRTSCCPPPLCTCVDVSLDGRWGPQRGNLAAAAAAAAAAGWLQPARPGLCGVWHVSIAFTPAC